MLTRVGGSPVLVRVVPFAIFIFLTACQGWFGEAGRYWFYFLKSVVVAGMLWAVRPFLEEMRWKMSWEAVAVGVGVLVMWVGLDTWYPKQTELFKMLGLSGSTPAKPALPWNPHLQFGDSSPLAWGFIVVRLLGSSLVVPPLEEVFFRSFVYRFLAKAEFLSVGLGQFRWMPFVVTAVIFGFEHEQWLAGILCGLAFQGLVIWKGRLGDAITAHAITNLLLGLYVIQRGAWQFW